MNHPIQVTVTADRRRARLTAIFRPILAIPLIVWGYVWGIAAIVAVVIAWFAALITGRRHPLTSPGRWHQLGTR